MKPYAISDFAKCKSISALTASPDGKTLCFVLSEADMEKNGYRSCLWLYENGRTRQLTAGGKERSFLWLNNEEILFSGNREDTENDSIASRFYRIRIGGGEATLAYTLPIPTEKLIPLPDGNLLALCTVFPGFETLYRGKEKEIAAYRKAVKEEADYEVITTSPWWWNGGGFVKGAYTGLFLYDTKAETLSPLSRPGYNISEVKLNEDKTKAYLLSLSVSKPVPDHFSGTLLSVLDLATEEETELAASDKGFTIEGIGPCRSFLLILAGDGVHGMNTDTCFYRMDYDTHEISRCIPERISVGGSVGSDVRHGGNENFTVVGDTAFFTVTREDGAYLYKFENNELSPLTGKEGSVDGFALLDGLPVLAALYDMRPQELYTLKGKRLTDFNGGVLRGKYTAVPEKLTVDRTDHDVHGFVLKPFGYEPGKKYPVILDIHGGPKTVYGEVFCHEMQYFAGLGYFVIFCNPTGSDGKGSFMDIRGKYGTVDYEDIMAFTDSALAAYPDMDENNLFETGGSYGGFMTNWIIGHTDRFNACASQRSISNWFSFCGVSDIGYPFAEDQTAGNIWETPEKMWEQSPLRYAGRCKTPTLFLHSFEDYRCPIDQGYQMYTALLQNGVESRMICFRGENHELSRSGKPKHRVRRLQEITEWFEKHKK